MSCTNDHECQIAAYTIYTVVKHLCADIQSIDEHVIANPARLELHDSITPTCDTKILGTRRRVPDPLTGTVQGSRYHAIRLVRVRPRSTLRQRYQGKASIPSPKGQSETAMAYTSPPGTMMA